MAPILDSIGEKTNQIDTSKVQSSSLFGLLEAMEKSQPDSFRILELVKMNNDSNQAGSSNSSYATSTNASSNANQASSVVGNQQTGNDASAPANLAASGQQAQGSLQAQPSYLSPIVGQFSSPASLLTTAGSSSAVLAVSGKHFSFSQEWQKCSY